MCRYTCVNVHACACVYGAPRTTLGVICQFLDTLFLEVEFLIGLELAKQARLADQRSLGISVALPALQWDHYYNLLFFM